MICNPTQQPWYNAVPSERSDEAFPPLHLHLRRKSKTSSSVGTFPAVCLHQSFSIWLHCVCFFSSFLQVLQLLCPPPLELACLHTPTVCLFAAFSPTPHHSHFAVPVHNSRTLANLWEGHSPLLLTPCMNNGTEYWLNINKCFLKDKEKIWFIK